MDGLHGYHGGGSCVLVIGVDVTWTFVDVLWHKPYFGGDGEIMTWDDDDYVCIEI